ncbi:Alpha/Beta hydrolase protein [Lenzites betulinus]|nr:Alpha/Beta hydrolase protein [Lenzites betulinus]
MATTNRLYVHHDSGAPEGRDDYTTLVVVHGYVWHAATFAKLLPHAAAQGVRIILLNRREYPGTTQYTEEERAGLPPIPEEPLTDENEIRSARQMLLSFMRDRALELYHTIQDIVTERAIPAARPESHTGGIVLVGWSMGATWMTALLTHIAEFPIGAVNLRDYVRRVILSDPPSSLLGYPYPKDDPYNPFFDTSLTHEERLKVFTTWITSYYAHGATLAAFERRRGLTTPVPTIEGMTTEDFESTVHVPPGLPGGADWTLILGCITLGAYKPLREGALYLSDDVEGTKRAGDGWRDVEVRYVWGERSIWEVPYAAQLLRQEAADAKKGGKPFRKLTTFCIRGANHFAQWDYPEESLRAFLAGPQDCDP